MYFLSDTSVDCPLQNSVNYVFMGFSESRKRLDYSRILCHQKDNFLGIAHQKATSFLSKFAGKRKKSCLCKKPINNESDTILRRKNNSRVALLNSYTRKARRTRGTSLIPPQKISKATVTQKAKIAHKKLTSQLLRRGSTQRVSLCVPFLPYFFRQGKKYEPLKVPL